MAVRVTKETQPRVVLKGANSGSVNSGVLSGSGDGVRVSMTFTATAEPLIVIPYGNVAEAQLEAGSFATSYIPTSGSQVTRSADIASIPVSAFGYNQDAGTVVVEVNLANRGNSDTISEGIASLKGSGAVENIGLYHVSWAAPGQIQWDVRSSNSAQAAFSPTTAANVTTIAYAFAENSFNIAVNGIAETEDTSGTVPSGITDIIFGSIYSAGDFPLNGHIKSIQYYPRRLTDAQLQELTS